MCVFVYLIVCLCVSDSVILQRMCWISNLMGKRFLIDTADRCLVSSLHRDLCVFTALTSPGLNYSPDTTRLKLQPFCVKIYHNECGLSLANLYLTVSVGLPLDRIACNLYIQLMDSGMMKYVGTIHLSEVT